ncbi:hypothetical protein J1614_005082 [Plenodomus biglobosus]|nr:hypothetical protein J1614_005082 [Plenodomus biglobosus]
MATTPVYPVLLLYPRIVAAILAAHVGEISCPPIGIKSAIVASLLIEFVKFAAMTLPLISAHVSHTFCTAEWDGRPNKVPIGEIQFDSTAGVTIARVVSALISVAQKIVGWPVLLNAFAALPCQPCLGFYRWTALYFAPCIISAIHLIIGIPAEYRMYVGIIGLFQAGYARPCTGSILCEAVNMALSFEVASRCWILCAAHRASQG